MQKAATPGPVQLVEGAVGMLAKAPAATFSLADLLAALCKQNGGENGRAVLKKLVELLRGLMDGAPSSADRSPASLQAPAHLLAVLTAEDPSLLHIIHEQGTASPVKQQQTTVSVGEWMVVWKVAALLRRWDFNQSVAGVF